METSEIRNLVKDLDLTLQPRSAPRYKCWLPLATQQLRLRSLIQIIGYNLNGNVVSNEAFWFYYTLHRTSMSSPLYTSEPIDNTNPRWSSLELPILHATGYSSASEIILRLWRRTMVDSATSDVTVFTWGVSFTGLAYIGPKLPSNLETVLKENSIIFHFHGGFFMPVYCFVTMPDLKRYLRMSVNACETKDSYAVSKLTSLRSKMQALKQQSDSVKALRIQIASGDNFQTTKYSHPSLNRLFQFHTINREKKVEIMKMRKELEMARFRMKLLEQERARKMGELRILNQLHAGIMEENQDHGSDLMERYRELNKDIERLHGWQQNHVDTRDIYVQMSNQLAHRRRQLISELSLIYFIKQDISGKFLINDIHLPDSEELELTNDTQVAVALGFVSHTTQMIANFLNIPTRYPIIHYGSRSKVIDHITDGLADSDRQFPLFVRSKDKQQFRYAVYLLNKNIAQLRWYCGLPTADLRATLPNLATLLKIKPNQPHLDNSKRTFSTSSLDTEVGNGKHVPLTPPIQKLIFEKCHRFSQSMGQLKTMKSFLGSSLDQGLDRPIQPLVLGNQMKRICKSEESAIDNGSLVSIKNMPDKNITEASSTTILNSTIDAHISDNNFPCERNDVTIESNIEIMIPTSVSKSMNVPDSLESSVSIRDRSSNSISSCEMALSGSQNDGDESPNGKNVITKEKTDERDLAIHQNLKSFEDTVDNSVRNGEHGDKHDAECNSQNYNLHCTVKSANARDVFGQNTPLKDAVSNKEDIIQSSISLDNDTVNIYDESKQEEKANSIYNYTQKYVSPQKNVLHKCYTLESGSNVAENQLYLQEWFQDNEGKTHTTRSPTLEKESSSVAHSSDNSPTEHSYLLGNESIQTSSEYIDIIKRSSENVFARTEALANKKSSFKVMKPRL